MFLDKKSCARGSIFKGDIDAGFYRVCWLFYRKKLKLYNNIFCYWCLASCNEQTLFTKCLTPARI